MRNTLGNNEASHGSTTGENILANDLGIRMDGIGATRLICNLHQNPVGISAVSKIFSVFVSSIGKPVAAEKRFTVDAGNAIGNGDIFQRKVKKLCK